MICTCWPHVGHLLAAVNNKCLYCVTYVFVLFQNEGDNKTGGGGGPGGDRGGPGGPPKTS